MIIQLFIFLSFTFYTFNTNCHKKPTKLNIIKITDRYSTVCLEQGSSSISFSQGYIKYETKTVSDGTAVLYYKKSDHGVRFKLVNLTSKTLHCKVIGVRATWADGKTRMEDVRITYVGAGKSGSEMYYQTDNYSIINKDWKFTDWVVTEDINKLKTKEKIEKPSKQATGIGIRG